MRTLNTLQNLVTVLFIEYHRGDIEALMSFKLLHSFQNFHEKTVIKDIKHISQYTRERSNINF